MGLFGKERYGRMDIVVPGHHYTWSLPNFVNAHPNSCLDGENVPARDKTKFHFHMVIGVKGDVGFYLHYKSPPAPKYSYYFKNSAGESQRQHTAHTIPADAERCGHWNVGSIAELKEFVSRGDGTLVIHFFFDDDTVKVEGIEDTRVTWTIPSVLTKQLNPYTSKGFMVNNLLYVLRMDEKKATDEFVFFVFCRKGAITSHSLAVLGPDSTVIGQLERKDELGAQALVVPKAAVRAACGGSPGASLTVTLVMFKCANPLEFFNTAARNGSMASNGSVASPPRMVSIGDKKEQYFVCDDDV
jgi:hypothetical protein